MAGEYVEATVSDTLPRPNWNCNYNTEKAIGDKLKRIQITKKQLHQSTYYSGFCLQGDFF